MLSSNSSAFRIGVGTGEIHQVRISNIAIAKAGRMISFCTSWEGIGNAQIEEVSFCNISAHNVLSVIKFITEIGSVRNILLENLNVKTKGGFFITPKSKGAVSDIVFRNLNVELYQKQVPEEKNLINISNTDRVTFDSVNLICKKEDWENLIHSESNTDLTINNCNF